MLIGVTGAFLALILLIWGGRTLFRKGETPSPPGADGAVGLEAGLARGRI